jgi:hypothetical protein
MNLIMNLLILFWRHNSVLVKFAAEVRQGLKGLPAVINIDILVGQLAELLVVPKLNNAECVLPVKKVDPL